MAFTYQHPHAHELYALIVFLTRANIINRDLFTELANELQH